MPRSADFAIVALSAVVAKATMAKSAATMAESAAQKRFSPNPKSEIL